MSQLLSENRQTFTELAHRQGIAVSTVWRWALRGVRGVKLETICIGGKRFTTDEAFHRFVEGTTAAGRLPSVRVRSRRLYRLEVLARCAEASEGEEAPRERGEA